MEPPTPRVVPIFSMILFSSFLPPVEELIVFCFLTDSKRICSRTKGKPEICCPSKGLKPRLKLLHH